MSIDDLGTSETQYILEATADIVCAYVGHNAVQISDLSDLLKTVYSTLESLHDRTDSLPDLKPHVAVSDSITDDFLVCLEDGLKFKSLKRHLRSKYGLTPDAYREKWGLPGDYPMVAPSYARRRSELAKEMGLGRADN